MANWLSSFTFDPIAPLLASGDEALVYFTKRDLLDENVEPVDWLWDYQPAVRIHRKQKPDGSWKYPGTRKPVYPAHHYPLVETWKQFRFLVDKYGFTRDHPACERAAEFLFSCQTEEGDIRGMIGNQYAPYYTGAIMSTLVKAGYVHDARIEKGFHWLLFMRQDDGGWTIPILTASLSGGEQHRLTSQKADPIQPDRSKPFSHNWTGMVLRAFAAHPEYRQTEAAVQAAGLLKSRVFQPDVYRSYKAADHWLRFQFPFWWNNLVSAMDSISLIGLPADDPDIQSALEWFRENQGEDGTWKLSFSKIHKSGESAKDKEMAQWIGLSICRIFRNFYDRYSLDY